MRQQTVTCRRDRKQFLASLVSLPALTLRHSVCVGSRGAGRGALWWMTREEGCMPGLASYISHAHPAYLLLILRSQTFRRRQDVQMHPHIQKHAPKHPPAHSKGPQGNLNIPSCTAIPSTNLKKSVVLNADWYSLLLTINDHFVQWPWYAFLCFFSDMHHVEERCSREFSHPITTTWAAAQMRASCLLRCSPRLCWVPCTLVT